MRYEKKEIAQFHGYRFCATRRIKGTALHDGVGSAMVFSSHRRASKDANSQFSQHLNTQMMFFFFFFFFQHCCIFVFFFSFRPNVPLVFVKIVAEMATTCSVRENIFFGHEKVGSLGQIRGGRTQLALSHARTRD